MNPLDLLKLFCGFLDLGEDLADMFAEERPELFETPPESPPGDLDPTVREEIKNHDL